MLGRIRLYLPNKDLNIYMGSIFHGFLMDILPEKEVTKLHKQGLKPYSQSLIINKEEVYWEICTLDEATFDLMNQALISLKSIYLKHNDKNYEILKQNIETKSKDTFIKNYLSLNNANRYVNLEFLSPCAFKSQSRYVFVPTIRLIIQSLLRKLETHLEEYSFFSEEVLKNMEEQVEIASYKLFSIPFQLEGTTIPAFRGRLGIRIYGSDSLKSFIHLLIAYGEYSGIGIKTTIGMGKIRKIGSEIWNSKSSM